MKIESVRIENLRGLKEVSFDSNQAVNVIVGPNAMGKSTILEAIRMTKALLMPTAVSESQEVLQSLGVRSQHVPQYLNMPAIMRDTKIPLKIELGIGLSDAEIKTLETVGVDALAGKRLRARLGVSATQEESVLIPFLSTREGQELLTKARSEIAAELIPVSKSKKIKPALEIENKPNGIRGRKALDQEIVSFLDSLYLPHSTILSQFPADRAMPPGEVNIQVGGQDAAQQMRMHIAQPSTKYSRLKQYIVSQSVRGDDERNQLKDDFKKVFDFLLPGKQLERLSINPAGTISVLIKEISSGYVYDIDNMSSGEKGLILTFLLMMRNVAGGGILLLDEPELHLNPAVCRKIMPFLLNEVLLPHDKQAFICTHSPEILSYAFYNDRCNLLHLRSNSDISPILRSDKAEVFSALERLGTDASDVLFAQKGAVFVEGVDDVGLLEIGFDDLLSGYRVQSLGGRGEVEKEILRLKEEEGKGHVDSYSFFIFDRDRSEARIASGKFVRIRQWDRYCIENFLLDDQVIFDVMRENLKDPVEMPSRGEFLPMLRKFALGSIKQRIVFDALAEVRPKPPAISKADLTPDLQQPEIAHTFWKKIEECRKEMNSLSEVDWKGRFNLRCEEEIARVTDTLDSIWNRDASGKEILKALHRRFAFRISLEDFKRSIMKEMRYKKVENWKLLRSYLEETLRVA